MIAAHDGFADRYSHGWSDSPSPIPDGSLATPQSLNLYA